MIASGREAGWDSGPAAQGPSPQRAGTGRRRDPPHAPRSNARTSPSRTYVPRHLEPLALAEYHPGEPAAATARTPKPKPKPQPRPPPQGSPGAPAAAQCMPGHVVPPGHGRARGILGVVVQRLTERVAPSLGPPSAGGASAAAGGQGRRFRRRGVTAWSSALLPGAVAAVEEERSGRRGSVCARAARHRTAPPCPTAGKKVRTGVPTMSRRGDRPGVLSMRRLWDGGAMWGGCPLTSAPEGKAQPEGRRGRGLRVAAGGAASTAASDLSPHGRREGGLGREA